MATLTLDPDEKEAVEAWKREHEKGCHLKSGTIGDRYSFVVTPTGIGTFLCVQCPCGNEFHLDGNF